MDILYELKKEGLRRGLSQRTIVTYAFCVRKFMQYCKKDWRKVTKKDIKDYMDVLVERGLTGSTLNVHLNALKFVFEEILCKRIMLRIHYSKTPKTLPVFLTKEEVIRLFNAVENSTHKLILELLYSAGLRVSEAVSLQKKDLEFERGIGWVRKGKGRKDRPFIIARCIAEKLKAHVAALCSTPDSYLFPGRKGRHLHTRSVEVIVKQAAKRAGIEKHVHPHTLRHSFATHLIENGYDVAAVQPLLGHNSAETTMVYVHAASPAMIKVKSPYDELPESKSI
ncbi:MAG: site-specific tyrosine recombinase/integron integrase [Nanoarchaeota archaeon]